MNLKVAGLLGMLMMSLIGAVPVRADQQAPHDFWLCHQEYVDLQNKRQECSALLVIDHNSTAYQQCIAAALAKYYLCANYSNW